jgi:uncharacterized damage-inducible protein DinB
MAEAWLSGPVDGVPTVLLPAAHALMQAKEEVVGLVRMVPADVLWQQGNAATPGFHLLHMAGALDRLFTYARGEALTDEQKAAARAETQPQTALDAEALERLVLAVIGRAVDQLRATDPATVLDERKVGRAGLPSTVLGCLFHGAEHTARHAGQFITTVKLLQTV